MGNEVALWVRNQRALPFIPIERNGSQP